MRIFQILLAFGVLGLALWGLTALSDNLSTRQDDLSALTKDVTGGDSTLKPEEGEAGAEKSAEAEKPKDYYTVNPFEMPPKDQPLPKAVMADKHHDFSRMALGRKGTHDFILKNEGTVPLKVAKGPTMCKCTLNSMKEQEIAPGEEIKVTVEYEPKSQGDFSQTAIVWTNDPENPKVEMLITGKMYSEVTTRPESGWILGTLPPGTEKEFHGYIYSYVQNDLQITDLKTSSDKISVQIDEVPAAEVEVVEGEPGEEILKAYKVSGKVVASEIIGQIKEEIEIKTNNAAVPEIKLPVQAVRTGPMVIISKGWYAEKQLLQLGRIPAGQGKIQKLIILIEAFDQELKLSNIDTGLPFVSLRLQREQTPPDAPKHKYIMEVEISKDAPSGEWTGPRTSTISFDTNHPKVPHFEIHLDFEII